MTRIDDVQAVREELQALSIRVSRLRTQPETKLTSRPSAGGWSALECVAHLNITSDAFLPVLSAGLARAPSSQGDAPLRMGVAARLFLWYMNPPYRTRSKTPARFEPEKVDDIAGVFAAFDSRQARVLALLQEAKGRAIDRVQVVSPFDARFSYNLFAAFKLFAAHQRRHIWQAERVGGRG